MRIPPRPPPLKQDIPIAPIGVYTRARNGEVFPIELRYAGKNTAGTHQWHSTELFHPWQVWKVGWQYLPPLTDVNVDLKP